MSDEDVWGGADKAEQLDVVSPCTNSVIDTVPRADLAQWRADLMPYGRLKESGLGKEEPRCVVQEMTELKLVVLHLTGSP